MYCYGYTGSNINVVSHVKVRIVCVDVSDVASSKEHDLVYVDVNQLLFVDVKRFLNYSNDNRDDLQQSVQHLQS